MKDTSQSGFTAHGQPEKTRWWQLGWYAILMLALATVANYLAPQFPLLIWGIPVLLLLFIDQAPRVLGFLLFFATTVPIFLIQTKGVIPIPEPERIGMGIAIGIVGYIPFALQVGLKNRLPALLLPLIFPFANVALEFSSSTGPFGTWGSMAYTQADSLWIMQLASLTGIWGITFLISWIASSAWWAISNWNTSGRKVGANVWMPVSVLLLAIGFGGMRIFMAPSSNVEFAPQLVACIASPDGPQPSSSSSGIAKIIRARKTGEPEIDSVESDRILAGFRSSMDEQMNVLLEMTEQQASAGAKLILWSEAALVTTADLEPEFLERCCEIAKQHQANLFVAMAVIQDDPNGQLFENKTVFIDDSGKIVGDYLKTKLVPGEPCQPGDGNIRVWNLRTFGNVASIICFDADFPSYVQQIAQEANGRPTADVLVVSANDWKEAAKSHLQMASFRAVENGVWLIRSTSDGSSAIVNPLGKIVYQSSSFDVDQPMLTGEITTPSLSTIYPKIGDAFAWVCSIGLLLLLALAIFYRRAKRLDQGVPCK